MRIGINLLPYNYGGQGGAEVYTRNLLQALSRTENSHQFYLLTNSAGASDYRYSGFHTVAVASPRKQIARTAYEQIVLPYLEKRLQLDVLFSNYVIPFTPGGCRRIVNIHDMLYWRYPSCIPGPKHYWWRLAVPRSAARADLVLTVSEASRRDIVAAFPAVKRKMRVQSEGVDSELAALRPDRTSIAKTLSKHGLKCPFILSAATFGIHKNIPRLLQAYQNVRNEVPGVGLVLTGRVRQFRETVEPTLLEGVTFTDYVSVKELADLYAAAQLYVLPSIYEGFGLSILEAQHFGCPVATSSAEAPREVGGEGVAIFDPWDAGAISATIAQLLRDDHKRAVLVNTGRTNLSRYSWELAATQFVAACEEAA